MGFPFGIETALETVEQVIKVESEEDGLPVWD